MKENQRLNRSGWCSLSDVLYGLLTFGALILFVQDAEASGAILAFFK